MKRRTFLKGLLGLTASAFVINTPAEASCGTEPAPEPEPMPDPKSIYTKSRAEYREEAKRKLGFWFSEQIDEMAFQQLKG